MEWNKLTSLVLTNCPIRNVHFKTAPMLEWLLRLRCLKELTIACPCDHQLAGACMCTYGNKTMVLESGHTVKIYGAYHAIERYIRMLRVEMRETVKEIAVARRELAMA